MHLMNPAQQPTLRTPAVKTNRPNEQDGYAPLKGMLLDHPSPSQSHKPRHGQGALITQGVPGVAEGTSSCSLVLSSIVSRLSRSQLRMLLGGLELRQSRETRAMGPGCCDRPRAQCGLGLWKHPWLSRLVWVLKGLTSCLQAQVSCNPIKTVLWS